jgi:putative tricarboxylic transport membrane protein
MANVITLLLPVFSLWYLWQSYLLPSGNVLIGARTFPLLTGGLMLVVSLILVWQQFRPAAATAGDKKTAGPVLDVEEGEGEITVEDWPATLVVIGAVLAFIVAFEPLGFVIAITLFLFGLSTFFSPQRWVVNLIVAVCFALGAYVLFTQGLSVQLPNGPLESLF